jgi:hypothetical protein
MGQAPFNPSATIAPVLIKAPLQARRAFYCLPMTPNTASPTGTPMRGLRGKSSEISKLNGELQAGFVVRINSNICELDGRNGADC